MGKRKRASDHNQIESSSDTVACSSGMELLSDEKRLLAIDSMELKNADGSMKLQIAQRPSTTETHQQSLSRSIFLKRSRHHFAHQYSRRGAANSTVPSSSRGKLAMRDDKLPFKLAAQYSSELGEYRERAFFGTERIKPTFTETDSLPSGDVVKKVCGICRKLLITKYYVPELSKNVVTLSEVAVMGCGHIYHSECLDEKTSFEEKRDPPCPSCKALPAR